MEALMEARAEDSRLWRQPRAWMRGQALRREFWTFFAAAFFW
jgi:hypothetical protein